MVRQAAEAVERSECRTYTNENLHELFEDVKIEGRLCAFVQKGIYALNDDEYIGYTDENLHEFVEDVQRHGLERLKARNESINACC